MPNDVVLETNLPGLKLRARGKVRDIYEDGDRLLIVATDRISAFDYILATGIPDKGRVLTQMTLFWLDFLRDMVPNHFLSTRRCPPGSKAAPCGCGAPKWSMSNASRAAIFPAPAGRIISAPAPSAGFRCPKGLRESDELPEPIFTPATKAQTGHDENISFEHMAQLDRRGSAARLRDLTLAIYKTRGGLRQRARHHHRRHEVRVRPDRRSDHSRRRSSDARFVALLARGILLPGGAQPSYDKQYVRDYLESIHWNKQPPAPALPEEVARRTSEKYKEAYRALTGKSL